MESFDPNKIKIDEKSYKTTLTYYIGYVTIEEYVKIHSVIPSYLIVTNLNGYFEEINKNKYLTLVPDNKNKEKIKNMKNCVVKSEI